MDTSTYTGASGASGGAVKDQVQQVREEVQETASRAIGGAQEQVQELTGKARGQVRDQIDQRISQTGERAESTADDLRAVAKELRNRDNAAPAAKVADQLADRVEGVARYLRQGDVDSILRDVEGFGRRQPWAVLAGGLALGFAASRMLKASSSQRFGTTSSPPISGSTSTRSRDEIRSGLESSSYLSGGTSSTAIGVTAPQPAYTPPTPPAPHAPQ